MKLFRTGQEEEDPKVRRQEDWQDLTTPPAGTAAIRARPNEVGAVALRTDVDTYTLHLIADILKKWVSKF